MRHLVYAATLLAVIGRAQADDTRVVPAVGTTLTYRMLAISTMEGRSSRFGQIYTHVVTSSDGATAAGFIKPLAMIWGCPASDATNPCVTARKSPKARQEGDLVVVPVPAEISDSLAKQSAFKVHYFITELRKFAFPGTKDPDNPDERAMGPEPAYVLTNTMECDSTELQRFLPLGKTPQITLACKATLVRVPGAGSHVSPLEKNDAVSVEISDQGVGQITLPSGKWEARKFAIKVVPADSSRGGAQSEVQFSTKLGVPIKTHSIISNLSSHTVTETDSELIAFTQ